MNEMEHSSARSVTAFVFGIISIAASFAVWSQTDLQGVGAVFGIWLGLGCLVWSLIWVALCGPGGVGQLVARAAAFVAATMAVMVGTGYLAWDQAGLYLLETLAVVSVVFWLFNRAERTAGKPNPDEASGNRSALSFVVGVLFTVAALVTWAWTDVPQDEVFWGLWVGLGCWGWTIVWRALSKSADVSQVVAQAAALVAVVMASMVSVDYLTWDQAGLYLLETMAVISAGFGLGHWLDQPKDNSGPAPAQAEAPAPAAA